MPFVPHAAWPFCGASYQGISPNIACDRSQNLYLETAKNGAKSPALIGRPGLSAAYFTCGASTGITAQLAIPEMSVGIVWVCANDANVYAFNSTTGVALAGTPLAMGSSGVQMVYNGYGTGMGNQILIRCANNAVYVVDLLATTITRVTDSATANLDAISIEYADGFFFAARSSSANQVNVSAPLDGTSWQVLNFVRRTGAQDRLTSIAWVNSQMAFMGQQRIEWWYDAGNPTFPLQRTPGATVDLGLMAPDAWTKSNNTLYWLGADTRGFSRVYAADGANPVPVSTVGIENLINSYGPTATAKMYAYQEAGHNWVILNFPLANSGNGATLAYDTTENAWSERFFLSGSTQQMHRVMSAVAMVQGSGTTPTIFAGDPSSGAVYIQSLTQTSDFSNAIRYIRQSQHIGDSMGWLKYNLIIFDCDNASLTMTMTTSRDGGNTFGGSRTITAQAAPATGYFAQYQAWQNGRAKDLVVKLQIDSSTQLVRIAGAYLSVIPGNKPNA